MIFTDSNLKAVVYQLYIKIISILRKEYSYYTETFNTPQLDRHMFLKILVFLLLIFQGFSCYARFHSQSAENYDLRDQTITPEYWSDKISYYEPSTWNRKWLEQFIGYKGSFSSFNYRRHQYLEEIMANKGK